MKRFVAMIITLSVCTASAVELRAKQQLAVAIAANLSTPMIELKAEFEKQNPDVELILSAGASGKLTSQIQNGAPFELFLSADIDFPKKLAADGLVAEGPTVYASSVLVLFTTQNLDLKKGLSLLDTDAVKRIAIANPKIAPHGKATVEALTKAGLFPKIESKVIYAESITQTAQYVLTAADAGFIAKSVLYDKANLPYNIQGKYWVELDRSLYPKLEQSMVILKKGRDDPYAKKFYDFMISPVAKRILLKYGYLL
jgi:molybdate transport system substrate-binding protein